MVMCLTLSICSASCTCFGHQPRNPKRRRCADVITQAVKGSEQQRLGGTHTALDATFRPPLRPRAWWAGAPRAALSRPGRSRVWRERAILSWPAVRRGERGLSRGSPWARPSGRGPQKRCRCGPRRRGSRGPSGSRKGWPKDQGKKQRSRGPGAGGLGSWAVGAQRPLGRSLMPFHVCACLRVTLFPCAVLFSHLK